MQTPTVPMQRFHKLNAKHSSISTTRWDEPDEIQSIRKGQVIQVYDDHLLDGLQTTIRVAGMA